MYIILKLSLRLATIIIIIIMIIIPICFQYSYWFCKQLENLEKGDTLTKTKQTPILTLLLTRT